MHTHASRVVMLTAAMGVVAAAAAAQVKTTGGLVQGTTAAGGTIRVFSGIPYAAPPVGALRWQAPQPVAPWEGMRDASKVGPACMQGKVFGDIVLPDLSEDCLTLNIHTPSTAASDRLPVMVWIHGGGFQAGGSAEPRHDGLAFARKGVVLVTINYRLGVFGFFAHPALTRESGRGASGNYGVLDQVSALRWVRDNIAAFGGDPGNVTIFGESAGSFAVSAIMASPLARGLFHKAIGESGAYFTAGSGTLAFTSLADSEQQGVKFAASAGANSLAALRAQPAQAVLDAAAKSKQWFAPNLDGYFLTEDVYDVYAAGRQSQVPLLAGWNADEIRAAVTLRPQKPTAQSFTAETRQRFGDQADAILKAYPSGSDAEALESAAALATDMFVGYATWKWIDMQAQSGLVPVYRFSFDRKIPIPADHAVNGVPATARDIGARHAGEIEYVFGSLEVSLPKVPWEPADRKLSDTMTTYWANFARTGDPNGPGLPPWPRYEPNGRRVLHLDETIRDAPDSLVPRYETLDAYVAAQRGPKATASGRQPVQAQASPSPAVQPADDDPGILTPPAPREPRVNGPSVYGNRPGRPFLYRIPATGDRPMRFSAEGLPAGLALDRATGIIRGTIADRTPRAYETTIVAANARGHARRAFRIVVGDTLALTPPMGWNDWYTFYEHPSDELMRKAADIMIKSGLADHGYQYVNIDDSWMGKPESTEPDLQGPARDARGMINANRRFPDMKALTGHIHGLGLKAGIYTSPGPRTCAGFYGSYGHESEDAARFVEWGFDFLKYDWCSYEEVAPKGSAPEAERLQKPYRLMGPLLEQQSRDIAFNLCQYGMGEVWTWGGDVGGHSWRTTGDLGLEKGQRLPGFYTIGLRNAELAQHARPGRWNDPDYILIGYVGDAHNITDPPKPTTLTRHEQYSYMSMWALMAAPLFYSGDITRLDPFTLGVLNNAEVVAVDQDALGRQARIVRRTEDEFVLAKPMEDGSVAVGLFNLSEARRDITATLADLGLSGRQRVRDLWRWKDAGTIAGEYSASVARHGVMLVRMWPEGTH